MPTFVYRTERANASVLAGEIDADGVLSPVCGVAVRELPGRNGPTLGHGTIAEIAITVASGVMTTTISDALRRVIDRARDRADVEPQARVESHPAAPGDPEVAEREAEPAP